MAKDRGIGMDGNWLAWCEVVGLGQALGQLGDVDLSSLPKTVAPYLAKAAVEPSEASRRLWYDQALGEAFSLMCRRRS